MGLVIWALGREGSEGGVGLAELIFNTYGGFSSPAIVSHNFENKPKDWLRKYYALNRIVLSTILFIEIAVTLALIKSAGESKFNKNIIDDKFENVTIESLLRMPAEIRQDLNCANVCPAENVKGK